MLFQVIKIPLILYLQTTNKVIVLTQTVKAIIQVIFPIAMGFLIFLIVIIFPMAIAIIKEA